MHFNSHPSMTQCKLTRGFIYSLVHHMVLLMNPFTVALKIDLRGWACFAVQIHRLVLHNVSLFRFNEEVGQWLWRIRWKSFWKLMKKIIICREETKRTNETTKIHLAKIYKHFLKISKEVYFSNKMLS